MNNDFRNYQGMGFSAMTEDRVISHSLKGTAKAVHKYISRKLGKNGKWVYVYRNGNKEKRNVNGDYYEDVPIHGDGRRISRYVDKTEEGGPKNPYYYQKGSEDQKKRDKQTSRFESRRNPKRKENIIKENIIKENIIKENTVKENTVKENTVKENAIKKNTVKENAKKWSSKKKYQTEAKRTSGYGIDPNRSSKEAMDKYNKTQSRVARIKRKKSTQQKKSNRVR